MQQLFTRVDGIRSMQRYLILTILPNDFTKKNSLDLPQIL